MHSNTHARRCALSFEEMCYVQSGLNYPPLAFKTFLHVKTFCMSVYLTEIWVVIDWQLLLFKPSKPKH